MRKSRLLWLVLASLLLAACSSDQWETYRSQTGTSFQLALPEGAEQQIPDETSFEAAGEPVTLELITFRQDGARYAVASGALTVETPSRQTTVAILDDGQDWLEETQGAQAVRASAISWNGYPGRLLQFETPSEEGTGRGRAYVLLVDGELYLLAVTGPEDVIDRRANRFLASFDTKRE
jgi:hypothetical protein